MEERRDLKVANTVDVRGHLVLISPYLVMMPLGDLKSSNWKSSPETNSSSFLALATLVHFFFVSGLVTLVVVLAAEEAVAMERRRLGALEVEVTVEVGGAMLALRVLPVILMRRGTWNTFHLASGSF